MSKRLVLVIPIVSVSETQERGIRSKSANQAYLDNFDATFRSKKDAALAN